MRLERLQKALVQNQRGLKVQTLEIQSLFSKEEGLNDKAQIDFHGLETGNLALAIIATAFALQARLNARVRTHIYPWN